MLLKYAWKPSIYVEGIKSIPKYPYSHYNSHKDTIQEARKLVAERLQDYGTNDDQLAGNDLQTVGVNGDTACTVSCVK